jgi:hypothetical protein
MTQFIVKICSILFFLSEFLCFSVVEGQAQEALQDTTGLITVTDSITRSVLLAADSVIIPLKGLEKKTFKPNSTKAALLSFIPGMGQIYNRKYWKLPLVYGGYMGFLYAVTWNNKNYQDYWGAYSSIMKDAEIYNRLVQDAGGADVDYAFNKDWTDFISTTDYKSVVNNSSYHSLFKSRKDFYRRNRDLSIILTVGWFAICMVDAYVDAELFDFDISPNLSMRVEPIISPATRFSSRNIGINCNITF